MRRALPFLICLTAVLFPGLLAAQATSSLRGQVRDPQGAAVPDATVTVTVEATGLQRRASTGRDGYYVIANLPPGTVRLRVAAKGFADVDHEAIVVEVGQTVTRDVELTVGGVAETIS